MRPRILFISICPRVSATVRSLMAELGVSLEIFEGGMTKGGLQYARDMASAFDVIVSQGGTATHIQRCVTSIPVVTIGLTISDFLEGFDRALKYEKPLALICVESEVLSEMERIAEFAGNVAYRSLAYSDQDEFERQCRIAEELEGHTLIGFSCYCMLEMEQQFRARGGDTNFVLIAPTEASIRQAVLSAKSIVDLKRAETLRAKRLGSIVDYAHEGIFSLDMSGVIMTFNAAAEQILGIDAASAVGKSLTDQGVSPAIRKLYGNGSFCLDEIIRLADADLLVNRVPITVGEKQEESIVSFLRISDLQKLEVKTRMKLHSKGLVAKHAFGDIIGKSGELLLTIDKAKHYSDAMASVLIEGETGTGKELFVQSIHNASKRRGGPFVALNCAALPEHLLESELFGYEEGAFTGAKKGGKAGVFELAHDGTIFLDEIGEISPSIQSRLLRVLQEREVFRIGSDRVTSVNVRVLAATKEHLNK